jgi:hypothetical protein
MNKFLLIAIFISAIVECCLSGFGGPDWESDPKAKLIIQSVCDVNKRPDATQWANLLNCTCHNKTVPPEQEKFRNMVLIFNLKPEKVFFEPNPTSTK